MDDLSLDLSGVGIVLEGIPEEFAAKLRRDWTPFVTRGLDDPLLHVSVTVSPATGPQAAFDPHALRSEIDAGAGRVSLPGGTAQLETDGRVQAELEFAGQGGYFNLINLMMACLAARLPSRGAMLLHAACLVVDERAYVLVGAGGAGKSTWTAIGAGAGAHAVGDDMLLIDDASVLGSPFRPKELPGQAIPGRWPIAALLFPKHGARPALAPVSRLLTDARLLANLPFVAKSAERDPCVAELLDRLASRVPCQELTFGRDPSFLALLRPGETPPT